MTIRRNTGALAGWRVIDLSRVLGGPLCTQILGDHGADVIKVEPPQGDETRTWGPPFQDGESAYYTGINRNKRSIGLDLSKPKGRDIVLRMLEDADVLIENFRIGTMERWGLGFEEVLEKRFPSLIYCRISGFGADGPLGGLPGYDGVAQALSGLMSVNGTPESGPVRVGVAVIDMTTAMTAAIGILAAAAERGQSGQGQFVEVALYDAGLSLLHPQITNWFMSNRPPQLVGNPHPNVVPYDRFETKTSPIFVAALNERQFGRLCGELGAPELAEDKRFATNADRVAHRKSLYERLIPLFADADGEILFRTLLESGVPAGSINDVPTALAHPHTQHRDMLLELDGYRGVGIPAKLQRTPGSLRSKPPLYSNDGRAILTEIGYQSDEIENLVKSKVLIEKRRQSPKP